MTDNEKKLPPSILRRSVYSASPGTPREGGARAGGGALVTTFKPRARPRMWGGGGGGAAAGGKRGGGGENSPPFSGPDKKKRRRLHLSTFSEAIPHHVYGSSTSPDSRALLHQDRYREHQEPCEAEEIETRKQHQQEQPRPTKSTPRLNVRNGYRYKPRYSSRRGTSHRRAVSFPTSRDDLVTDVFTRPKTLPSEVSRLFYSKDDQNRFKAEKKRLDRWIARGGMIDVYGDDDDNYDSDKTGTGPVIISDGHRHEDQAQDDDCDDEYIEDEHPTAEEVLRDNENFLQEEDDIPIAEIVDEIIAEVDGVASADGNNHDEAEEKKEQASVDDEEDDENKDDADGNGNGTASGTGSVNAINQVPVSPRGAHSPAISTASCRRALADSCDGNENEEYATTAATATGGNISGGGGSRSKANDAQSSPLLIASC